MAARVTDTRIPHASVVQVGVGNIGSHAAPLIARSMASGRVTIIDPDYFDEGNVTSQHILPRQVGLAKAAVLAEAVQAINPGLAVEHYIARVEDVPLGVLRADLIVAGVDNREARQAINARAWHTGSPWIDTAVDAALCLVRMNLHVPAADAPCLICAWSDAEFASLAHRYSCSGERVPATVARTAAPAELGAVVAALACSLARRVLSGDRSLAGQQVMLDVAHYRQYVARLPFNPACRQDHEPWQIETLATAPRDISLGEAFGLFPDGGGSHSGAPGVRLGHDSQPFVRRLCCMACGQRGAPLLRLSGRLPPGLLQCGRCGARREPTGFDQDFELALAGLAPRWLQRSLGECGFRTGDVFSLRRGVDARHFQIGAAHGQDLR